MKKAVQKSPFGKLLVLFVIMCITLLPTAWAQVIEDGTEAHPFLIESKQELLDFQNCMNANADFYHNGSTFVTTEGSGYTMIKAGGTFVGGARAYFRLTTDIVLNQGNVALCECYCGEVNWDTWTPVEIFSGSFDGDNHTISGMYCDWPEGTQIGFFKEISNGEVKNLGVVNSYVRGNRYVGGIAGEIIDNAVIEHCFFWGNIESSGDNIGGITGHTLNACRVKDCYTTGFLYAKDAQAGNIVGYNRTGCTVQNCYSSMWSSSEAAFFGGLCGRNAGTVTNCYYDKQMTSIINNIGTAKLTTEIATSTFTALGSAFVSRDEAYPVLSGFDYTNNPFVRLSVVPVYLHVTSSSKYETVDSIKTDFTVGVPAGGVCTISSWNNAGTFVEPNQIQINRHGIVDFTITIEDTYARVWGFIPKIWPYLGSGTNVFTIDSLNDFRVFRDGINSGERFKYKCIWIYPDELDTLHWLQTVDFDLDTVSGFVSCGTRFNPFRGYYDGGHHTVSNLRITGNSSNVGFFGCTRKANIKNLDFVNPSVTGFKNVSVLCGFSYANLVVDSCTVTGGSFAASDSACGAFCGRAYFTSSNPNTSRFSHCTVENMTISGASHTGGICGGSLNGRARFLECSVSNTPITGSNYVGGVCGYVYNNSSVRKCNVQGGSVTSNASYVGGLCGYMYNTDTISDGRVQATPVRGLSSSVGGVCGYMYYGAIENCIMQDSVVAGVSSVGGICGYVYNGTSKISNCTNRSEEVRGEGSYIGGICGGMYYQYGIDIQYCKNYAPVSGLSCVAGIFGGSNGTSSYTSNHRVKYCYNAGPVELTGTGGGGIAGSCATVSYSINTGVVKGGKYVGGIGGSESTWTVNASYSMNTADVYCDNWGGGITYNGTSTHCVNYGNVLPLNSTTAGIVEYGISSSASNSFNVGRIWGVENSRTAGNNGANVYYDKDFVGDQFSKSDGNALEQSQMIGTESAMKSGLGTTYWLYEENRYPRLKWTNDYDWARDVAIAASQPVLLATEEEDANTVKQGVKLYGCSEGVTWRLLPPAPGQLGGCIFTNDVSSLACMGNAVVPAVTTQECKGYSTVAAILNDTIVKRVMLRPYVPAPLDTLTIDNLEELHAFRDSINSSEPFWWKGYYVPRFAAKTHFRLTTDIAMPGFWTPIGNNYTLFRGIFLGDDHTVSGLQSNGDYAGLFCHVNGTVRDLNFTGISFVGGAETQYKGAVCSYLRDGNILNCTATGTMEGMYCGGIVGWSDGKDTISNCVNNCTVTSNSSQYVGGILGYATGDTYISDCENKVDLSGLVLGGIVGYCGYHNYTCGKVSVNGCSNEGDLSGSEVGGIIGFGNSGSSASHCTNTGNIVSETHVNNSDYSGSAGGIICSGSGLNVSHCVNTGNVKADQYAAGIVSQSGYISINSGCGSGTNTVDSCSNGGDVEGLNVAGILYSGTANHCANYGAVTGHNTCSYVAGVCAEGTANNCYNVGMITALSGNSATRRCVGGICAIGSASYSYNAGQIYGYNSRYVGGICGVGTANYCYNSNTVRSSGTHRGSIVGINRTDDGDSQKSYSNPQNSYYDKQMSPMAGVDGADNTSTHVEGLPTTEMIGNGLSGLLGADTVWAFTEDFYPQLKDFKNTPPSLSSVMPVLLQNNETVLQAYNSFYMKGCDIGQWHVLQGASLRLDTASVYHQCEASVVGLGVVKLGAAVGGTIYRQDRILIGISEDAPYIVKNLQEMRNFRDVINQDGHYNMADSTFHLTLTHADSAHIGDYADIQNGGLDLYFKLVTDLDMSSESNWLPVGCYDDDDAHRNIVFQGTFMGDNHVISHLTIKGGSYKGLFGRNSVGEIRDLIIRQSRIVNAGNNRALLCASNFGGWIKNCAVENSSASVTGQNIGLICGANEYATILKSRVKTDTIRGIGNVNNKTLSQNIGGICGYQNNSVIDTCYAEKLVLRGWSQYMGGISGQNNYSLVNYSHLTNSHFNTEGEYVGGISGYLNQSYGINGIHNCTNTGSVIQGTGQYFGGIVGYDYYGHVKGCTVSGGTVSSTNSYVGGIVGIKSRENNVSYATEQCLNENVVSGYNYVGGILGYSSGYTRTTSCTNTGKVTASNEMAGGIVGYMSYSSSRLDTCRNFGEVSAKNYAGGLLGRTNSSYNGRGIYVSFNRGNVHVTGSYVGGLVGYAYNGFAIEKSYNTGNVSAGGEYSGGLAGCMTYSSSYAKFSFNSGIVTGKNLVGGLFGYASAAYAQYCYNAGIVKGRSMVGGLIGYLQSPSTNTMYNYNVGWVEGVSMMGAICGYTTDQSRLTNNAFDYQMCFYNAVSDNPHNGSTSLLTEEMLGDGLSSILTNSNWTYTAGYYPRVTALKDDPASIASASPVLLPVTASDTLRADGLPADTYTDALGNCGEVTWARVSGYTVSVSGCSFTGTRAERVRIGTVMDGDTIKAVQLLINISLQNPLEITDRIQMKKFRDLINSGQTFYYDPTIKEFFESESSFYVEVPPHGEHTYFKLMSNIDLSLEADDWEPVGNYDAPTYVNMCNGATTIKRGVPFGFYDDGGPNANYTNSKSLTHTFTSNDNSRVRLAFTDGVGDNLYDYIKIYDGPDANSPVLLEAAGGNLNSLAGSVFTSTGSSLTVYFYSNGSEVNKGWEAVLWCVGEHE